MNGRTHDVKNYNTNPHTSYRNFRAYNDQDQKIIISSALKPVLSFFVLRSHGVYRKGRDFTTLSQRTNAESPISQSPKGNEPSERPEPSIDAGMLPAKTDAEDKVDLCGEGGNCSHIDDDDGREDGRHGNDDGKGEGSRGVDDGEGEGSHGEDDGEGEGSRGGDDGEGEGSHGEVDGEGEGSRVEDDGEGEGSHGEVDGEGEGSRGEDDDEGEGSRGEDDGEKEGSHGEVDGEGEGSHGADDGEGEGSHGEVDGEGEGSHNVEDGGGVGGSCLESNSRTEMQGDEATEETVKNEKGVEKSTGPEEAPDVEKPEESFVTEPDADPSAAISEESLLVRGLDTDITESELDFVESICSRTDIIADRSRQKEKSKSKTAKGLKTSGRGSGTPSQKEHELQKENLKLSSENLELRFQVEQANKDLPRLTDQVADLKEMNRALKKDKAEVEKRLGIVRGAGRSGKTVPELEKTIGLMKRVVERVQRENESLKKTPASQDQFTTLERAHEKLKIDHEQLKEQTEAQLSSRLESKTRGLEKIVMENERLRKDIKRETEAVERLRVAKTSLEVTNDRLEAELEETKQKLLTAQSRTVPERTDSKAWKSSMVTRLFENKMKELEKDNSQKTSRLLELKQELRASSEKEERARHAVRHLEDQVEMLKNFPTGAKTDAGLVKELQSMRLTNGQLEREKADLEKRLSEYSEKYGTPSDVCAGPGYKELDDLLKATDKEKRLLQADVKKMQKELENFDPTFFEEIEDLKFNYNLEVKKNILLEEQLKKVCEQFGVAADIPTNVSIS